MAQVIGAGVSLRGIYDTKYNHTMNANAAIVKTDEGKALSQDIAGDATVKLAADGDRIVGSLFVFEDRKTEGIKVVTVSRKGYFPFTYTGAAPTLGHGVVGAGAGAVKGTGAAALPGQPSVWSINTTDKIVLVEIGL